ncbi:MAG: uncharacterized protein JWP97_5770 [Labilithrix sp.]|nr:uncharacterized protein [Labilithrix sp.]
MAFSVDIDFLVVGAVPVPADKTTLSPPKLKRNWTVQPGFGIQGAFCVYTGEGLAAFDATFEFWDETKEALWDQFANRYLVAPKGVRPAAIGVYHPVLMKAPFKIQNVQVTDIEGWSLVSPGHWQTRLTLLEYRPPAPFKPVKTEPVVPGVEKVAVAKPKTEQDIRMQEAAARLKAAAEAGK